MPHLRSCVVTVVFTIDKKIHLYVLAQFKPMLFISTLDVRNFGPGQRSEARGFEPFLSLHITVRARTCHAHLTYSDTSSGGALSQRINSVIEVKMIHIELSDIHRDFSSIT